MLSQKTVATQKKLFILVMLKICRILLRTVFATNDEQEIMRSTCINVCRSIRRHLHSVGPWAYSLDGRLKVNCTSLNQMWRRQILFIPAMLYLHRLRGWLIFGKNLSNLAAGAFSPVSLLFWSRINNKILWSVAFFM